ncbi:hypothetical protein VKT23_019191 [Stygiomarasmius scandens]|uniref:Uncharacterized protein n=1 Tax=Marasmiellus scandens TaxID=2682957 RepID=A0ABR1IM37_9AGAR
MDLCAKLRVAHEDIEHCTIRNQELEKELQSAQKRRKEWLDKRRKEWIDRGDRIMELELTLEQMNLRAKEVEQELALSEAARRNRLREKGNIQVFCRFKKQPENRGEDEVLMQFPPDG